MPTAQRLAVTVAWPVDGPTASGKSTFRLIDPAPQQIRVDPVFQRDGRNRYADSLAGRNHLRFELLVVASPPTTLRE
nr:hypothetical protein [Burkholderia sp. Bp9142]